MNMAYASEKEREMILLRKKRLHSILQYNLQQIDRKRYQQEYEKNQFENSYQTMASQAIQSLSEQNRRKSTKREVERQMLKDSYEQQIRNRQQRIKMEKLRDRGYLERQRAFSQYEQTRRMADLQKMFDRKVYQAVPMDSRKRVRTEFQQQQVQHLDPQPNHIHLPNINQKPIKTESNEKQSNVYQIMTNSPPSPIKHNLDNVYVQAIQKNKRMTPQRLT